jgi:hypothetical protein
MGKPMSGRRSTFFQGFRAFPVKPGLLPGGRLLHVFATFTASAVFPTNS